MSIAHSFSMRTGSWFCMVVACKNKLHHQVQARPVKVMHVSTDPVVILVIKVDRVGLPRPSTMDLKVTGVQVKYNCAPATCLDFK